MDKRESQNRASQEESKTKISRNIIKGPGR